MKKICLGGLCAVGLGVMCFGDIASGVKGVNTWNVGFFSNPVKSPVVIDGKLDEWDLDGQILSATIPYKDKYGVKIASMWDENYLYLSFDWRDPTPMHSKIDPSSNAMKGWIDDAVQLRIKVGDIPSWVTMWCFNKKIQAYNVDFYTLPKDDKNRVITWATKPGETKLGNSGIEMMTVEAADGKGFVLETKIPWSILSNGTVKKVKSGFEFLCGLEFMWGNDAGNWPITRRNDSFAAWDSQAGFFWTNEKAWGRIVLNDKSIKNPRTYKIDDADPYGVIPVRAKIPSGKEKFTLVLEDKTTGKRIRTVTGAHPVSKAKIGTEGDRDIVEVLWDGLDDAGLAVQPGTYRVRGIAMDHISLKYKSSFYNPGTPAWDTADTRGGWGADHSRPEFVAASKSNIVFGTKTPEGGYGLWAVGPDGKKVWSEKRGARSLTANDKYVYVLGGYYNEDEQLLFRVNPDNAAYEAFKDNKGVELPHPFPMSKVPQISNNRIRNIAVDPQGKLLACAMDNGFIVLLDAETLQFRGTLNSAVKKFYPLGKGASERLFGTFMEVVRAPLAFDGKDLYYFQERGDALVAFNVGTRTVRAITLSEKVEEPMAISLSRDLKSLYIADCGKDMQIKKFSLDGKFLQAYGKKGGRPRQGKYDKHGMIDMSGVAEDLDGNVWSVEWTECPRRVSVWNGKDSSFVRDYIGNTFYCGSGTYLHDQDSTKAYAGATEFKIDIDKGTYEPTQVLWNPDPKKEGVTFTIYAGMHGIGPIFYSSASGKKREYLFLADWGGRDQRVVIFMNDEGNWRPVTAITTIGTLLKKDTEYSIQAPIGEWAGLDNRDGVIWNDLNDDGYVTRNECEIVPYEKAHLPITCGWGTRPDCENFEFYTKSNVRNDHRWFKYRPVRFAKNGAPVYAFSSIEEMKDLSPCWEMCDIAPQTGKDLVLRFAQQENKKQFLIATDKKGNQLWRYPDWWHGVHGSHNPFDGNPNGALFGAIMIVGYAEAGGECGDVVMIRCNYLHDAWFTTDGFYLDKVFKGVLEGKLMPDTVEEARKMNFEELVGHGEPFMGWFAKQNDGKIRSIHGNFALACHICEVSGFETVKRFTSDDFVFTPKDAVIAEDFNQMLDKKKNKVQAPYTFNNWKGVSGAGCNAVINLENNKNNKTLTVRVNVTGDNSPWKNNGNDFTRLFKTGDAFDLQIGNNEENNQRLVFANYKGKPVCVQMRAKMKGDTKNKVVYESPVTAVAFECVRILPVDVKVVMPRSADGSWNLSATIPWDLLEIDPAKPIKGDFGIILSDIEGLHNAARVYYFNKRTGLISDLPNEARLMTQGWGKFIVE